MNSEICKLQFLGQAGYLITACGKSVLIDPYLSDSVGKADSRFARLYPPPVDPRELQADVYIVTHDHLDHLDPETIAAYGTDKSTVFVAPHLAAEKLLQLGVSSERLRVVDCGQTALIDGVEVTGVFALGTTPDTADTTGYRISFVNGKSVYHTSDTSWCSLLEDSVPDADILLVCINGKYGNLNASEAVRIAKRMKVRYVIPNHYDIMALNGENPEVFRYLCNEAGLGEKVRILTTKKAFEF